MWGVNHHPEIGDVGLQRERLQRLWENGGVTPAWFQERLSALDAWNASAATEHGLQKTTAWTFERPLRLHLAADLRRAGMKKKVRGERRREAFS